ncbi:Mu transposase C-terminal domain-containing protein [[Clostridium] symbiosum]|jgi:putative transposase|uniref:Mu transposase C-terminal domain-containing protein n=1 Tax=Clostridium symbiosum TaxID=1512 RepID=UPI0018A10EF9|nr:Mu transposase C-terminal domain-containing protein [[Clostridium] symbiosum]MDB2010824.1 Mu transposase C-terminal domain-containing protein [[Clostridium] symbiosum]MDB2026884.1 Mu transposase C-terminal domain-containing protein [[Clostridium] symbiosum]
MFVDVSGEVFKVVLKENNGAWLVSYENPCMPKFVSEQELRAYPIIEPPEEYLKYIDKQKNLTDGQRKRLHIIAELVDSEIYITDKKIRNQKVKEIADREQTTVRRIQKLYFRHLAGRSLVEERQIPEKPQTQEQKDFTWAVDTFYYSAKKMSLRSAYDLMLLSRYTDQDGHLMENHPSWHSFRHFFYEGGYHAKSRNTIARNGLTDYQRNKRPLFGTAMDWKDKIGAFQMDATQADIYLVSRLDKSAVIGRPNIYMAVDTATQLIAGIYVGLDAGEQAVINCLANAAMDKVEFCSQYGIEIKADEWPNTGLPGEIITDKGKEFIGSRMEELAMKYGIEFESLPPFRPDGKSLVEKSFDLIQQKYKPTLRGKGVIEPDAQERWAVDYRSQAVLTLEDFTKVVIHCVLYLNSCRIIQNSQIGEATPVATGLWKWYEEQGQSMVIPVSGETLYQFGLPRKNITLSRKGISNQGLWYVSAEYKKLLERKKIGDTVQIAYDPENVSQVYLVDGMEYLPFELASYCKQYAGATQTECQIEKDKHKASLKELERLDTEGRIKVLQNIQAIVGQAEYADKDKIDGTVIQNNRRRELA